MDVRAEPGTPALPPEPGAAPRSAYAEDGPQARGGPVLELRVANTDGQGARLRAAPSRAAEMIAVLPDGAIVQAIGQERVVTEERWRQVRAADGSVGWIASDLLAPAASADE